MISEIVNYYFVVIKIVPIAIVTPMSMELKKIKYLWQLL